MPNPVNFGGRQIIEPGVYSQILGQVPSPAIVAPYANVFVIDTGGLLGRGIGQVDVAFGGGNGANGQLLQNGAAVYEFTNSADIQKFVRGGRLYNLAPYLFSPSLNGNGPQKVYHARAATTTSPQITINLPAVSGSAGTLVINAKDEGFGSNGALNSGNFLSRGYGWKIKAGIINTSAFIIEFYQGQYRGVGSDGVPYDGITENSIASNY